jgi:hypothetical protein
VLIFLLAVSRYDSPYLVLAGLTMMGFLPLTIGAEKLQELITVRRKEDDEYSASHPDSVHNSKHGSSRDS